MRLRLFRAALCAVACAILATGQQAPAPKPAAPGAVTQTSVTQTDQPTVISVEARFVSMAYSVADKKGRFVTGLEKGDFDVLENGHPQTIQDFAAESALPLRVAVLIDTSNSIRERFRFEQEAASDFIHGMLRTNADKAMVVGFDSNPAVVAGLTQDSDKLRMAIQSLRPGGSTALYDAIRLASEKLAAEQPSHQFRRIIVILSDGDDTQSHSTRDQALEAAQVADTFIYAISTNNLNHGDTDGDKVLKYFTGQTGGKSFFPFQVEDLAQSFEIIAEEVRHQYSILYRPDQPADGLFHKVEIRVRGHKELTIRARSGYFAAKK